MNQAKWIWYYGDYEIFHGNLLNSRREEKGEPYPPFMAFSSIHANVEFVKRFKVEKATEFHVVANGQAQVRIDGFVRHSENAVYSVSAGEHSVGVCVCNLFGLPAAFVDGEIIFTDGSWMANDRSNEVVPVGCEPVYRFADDNVEVFPFSYKKIEPIETERTNDGFLIDFGKETFGFLCIEGAQSPIDVYYGESRNEALSMQDAILREMNVSGEHIKLRQRGFRYVFLNTVSLPKAIWAEYEYLPLTDIGSFRCNDKRVEKIFDLCAYTLHLNSRECYTDGIKRDRWVWAGDAYQAFMINPYLYFDTKIIKRTILHLLGTPPYKQHINTINDYSFYLIISVYDYWFMTDDKEFVSAVYPKVKALYDFCLSRLDKNGFVCARPGDWIFIDWLETLDKEGPHCVEQILLWRATRCIKLLAELIHGDCSNIIDDDALKKRIYEYYYKKELGGFIDGFVSGKNVVNRHANIFAILYDFVDEKERKEIIHQVLLNDNIPQIKTPYFSFYEMLALCKTGNIEITQKQIESYWGGMMDLGATTIWEEYVPGLTGDARYALYGEPYGKSLCHAWGSGPICFLGKYIAGVRPTSAGYKTYVVQPSPGLYKHFKAVVPLKDGKVSVEYKDGQINVLSDCDGGTLIWKGVRYSIERGKELKTSCEEKETRREIK